MSVNKLAETWRALAGEPKYPSPQTYRAGFDNGQYAARSVCAFDLESKARTAWHPVSEPPTEADSTEFGMVLMRDSRYPFEVWVERFGLVKGTGPVDYVEWARIRDVVLMPPQGGE